VRNARRLRCYSCDRPKHQEVLQHVLNLCCPTNMQLSFGICSWSTGKVTFQLRRLFWPRVICVRCLSTTCMPSGAPRSVGVPDRPCGRPGAG
jgi:hypothetical protein